MAARILGFLRFSFFGASDTKLSYADREKAFETLYAKERMETRFTLFEKLFLPSLKAQTDQDFTLIVITSTCMPEDYRKRLAKACMEVPQIELVEAETDNLKDVILTFTTDPSLSRGGLLQFRWDDDDAMGAHFIERLRYWQPHLPDRTLLTQPKGLMLYTDETGPHLQPMYRNLTGAGFAYFTDGPVRKSVFSFAHINAGRRIPFLSDPTHASYIQTFTPTSDTAFRSTRKIRKFLTAAGVLKDAKNAETLVKTGLDNDFPSLDETTLKNVINSVTGALEPQD